MANNHVVLQLSVFIVWQILVLSLRLHFTKDSTIINTAAATVRQLVSSVFERVVAEDSTPAPGQSHHELLQKICDVINNVIWKFFFK